MTFWQRMLDRPRQVAARRWFFQVHMWAGVLTAIYVIVSSVTGSLLVFRDELTAFVSPPPRADVARGESAIGADAAVEALGGALPGFRVASLVLPEERGGAYGGFLLSRGRFAYAEIHPVTGTVSKVVTRENSRWRFVEDLHNNLLTGRTGRVVNGIGGLSVALLCLTGLMIWWPGRERWTRALRVDWRARWPRRLWDLHGVTGILLVPLVFLIAVTGVNYTWPQWFRAAVSLGLPVAPREAPLRFPDAEGQPRARIAQLLASARAALPDGHVYSLQLPGNETQPIRAVMLREGERIPAQADAVVLHPVTAQVVRVERYAERPAGERALRWIGPLHAGRFAGPWSSTIWFLAGFGMALLAGTGLAVWWNRVVRQRLFALPIETSVPRGTDARVVGAMSGAARMGEEQSGAGRDRRRTGTS